MKFYSPIDFSAIHRFLIRGASFWFLYGTVMSHISFRDPEVIRGSSVNMMLFYVSALIVIEFLMVLVVKTYIEEKYQHIGMNICMAFNHDNAMNIMTNMNTNNKEELAQHSSQYNRDATSYLFFLLTYASSVCCISMIIA